MTTGVMHELHAAAGDYEVQWDSDNREEVRRARETFDAFRAKGYAAYEATAGGGQGTIVREFDQELEHIVLVRPNQGG